MRPARCQIVSGMLHWESLGRLSAVPERHNQVSRELVLGEWKRSQVGHDDAAT
jgi:hypothetical protein